MSRETLQLALHEITRNVMRSSLTILAMNVIAVSLAWPVHDEPVTWTQAGSGLVVLWAVASAMRLSPTAAER